MTDLPALDRLRTMLTQRLSRDMALRLEGADLALQMLAGRDDDDDETLRHAADAPLQLPAPQKNSGPKTGKPRAAKGAARAGKRHRISGAEAAAREGAIALAKGGNTNVAAIAAELGVSTTLVRNALKEAAPRPPKRPEASG